MNTLKPLLIVAVLAGVGYGVYVRLNRGNNAPPPPVAEGWDSSPSVQLPDQSSGAPWSPSTEGPGPAGPFGPSPGTSVPMNDGGSAPAYQPPGTMGVGAPPGSSSSPDQTAGGDVAAPFGSPPSYESAPPYGADTAPVAPQPGASAAGAYPPGPGEGTAPSAETVPIHDPYANSYEPAAPDPYQSPPYDPAAPDRYSATPGEASPPTDYAAPPAESAAPGAYPPSENPDSNHAAPGGPPAASGAESSPPTGDFAAALQAAQRELEAGQLAEALRQLSQWYGNPQLTPAEQQTLNQTLDQVAGTVVYSTQNLLEPPYEVQAGERLEDIGEKFNVPWKLLAKINGIEDPAQLGPGERLKVLRGPFQAVVSLDKRELTLLTSDGSYAGRFQIGVGAEHPPQLGTFPVSEKVVNPVYYGRDRAIGAEDVANPLGERWIGLGSNMGIHGTNDPQSIGRDNLPGSISLSERDVEDVFDILSLGSRVTIRR